MNSQTIKLYVLYVCTPVLALSALFNGLNANKNLSFSSDAHDRAKVLMAALPATPKAQKPQVKSNLQMAKLAINYHNSKTYQNVAWLLFDLGLFTFCVVKINKYLSTTTDPYRSW
jgi:hypothetical protein